MGGKILPGPPPPGTRIIKTYPATWHSGQTDPVVVCELSYVFIHEQVPEPPVAPKPVTNNESKEKQGKMTHKNSDIQSQVSELKIAV